MPFTVTQSTTVHFMNVSLTLWHGSNQLMIRQSLSLLLMPMLITLSGWSQSLILIDMGVMLFIFVICQVVSSWCAGPTHITGYLDTWILGVALKQLRLLHGRVGNSTIVINSLSPQMSELVEDAIAS